MQLRSGGYIVINPTEALVAIDVNSGRSTKERNIEETALKTNIEAAEEIARQVRLRDLAGLIVIDFIDMEETRHQRSVEHRSRNACATTARASRSAASRPSGCSRCRASGSGRACSSIRPRSCPHCAGTGRIRSVSSVALQLLRAIDEMLLKGATHNLIVRTRTEIALYLLNHKRAHLRSLEERFHIAIMVNADATIGGQVSFLIEKGEQVHSLEQAKALAMQSPVVVEAEAEEEEFVEYEAEEEQEAPEEAKTEGDAFEPESEMAAAPAEEQPEAENGQGRGKRRRRRGRRGGERREEGTPVAREASSEHPTVPREDDEEGAAELETEAVEGIAGPSDVTADSNGDGERRRRRRGRRGGRRNRRDRDTDTTVATENGHAEEAEPAVAAAEFHAEPVSEPVHHEAPPPLPREHVVERREEVQAEPILAAPPPPPAPAPESPRRRSTVREPAPIALSGEATISAPVPPPSLMPPPEPVVLSESTQSDRPRRSGWWAKRALGKD